MAERWQASRLGRSRPLRVGLWSLFAVLLLAGGDLVLHACGTLPVLGFARDYCPLPPDRTFAREVETGQSLRRQVHLAEMALVEAPPCAPSGMPPIALPTPAPLHPAPERPEPSATSKALDETIHERGGQKGLLQFSLAWETLDDLDLNVTCPGGKISSIRSERGPGICGDGVKDIDANRNLVENVSSTPVENVVWPTDYPEGVYRIEVIEFRAARPDSFGNSLPFTLRMRLGDKERECHSEVTRLPTEDRVERNGAMVIGTAKVITWKSGQPLPQCDFSTEDTVSTTDEK